jgi:ABC-type glutathione transport system ATPase component
VISGLVDSLQLSAAPDVEREVLLELEDLVVDYLDGDLSLRAVDHVNLTIRAGEIVGLAGESGCGKTTAANAILGILRPPAEVTGGRIRFRGVDLGGLSRNELRRDGVSERDERLESRHARRRPVRGHDAGARTREPS